MKLKLLRVLVVALFLAGMATGCDKQEGKQESKFISMPDATDKTCTNKSVKIFGEDFSHNCFLRGGFTKSQGHVW